MFRQESSQELIMFGESISPLPSAGAQNRKKKELVAVGTGQALVRKTERRRRKNPPITRLLEGRTDTASLYAIFLGIVRSLLTFVDDCTNGQRKEEEEGGGGHFSGDEVEEKVMHGKRVGGGQNHPPFTCQFCPMNAQKPVFRKE